MKRRVTSQSLSYCSTMAVLKEGCDSLRNGLWWCQNNDKR